jgi:hypothetical protein
VNLRKKIQKTIRSTDPGTSGVVHVNAAIAANVNEPGTTRTHVSSKQRIVQRGGRTEIFTEESEAQDKGE